MTARGWGAGIASAAAVIALITAVTRIIGFLRWIVSAWAVGRGCVGDVYAATNQIPNVLYEVVAGGALAVAIVPVISPMIRAQEHDRVRASVSALLTWAMVITVPLAVGLVLLSGPLGHLLVPSGCAVSQGEPAARLARWMLLVFAGQVVLYAVGMVATGALQAHRRFLAPTLAPLLSSLVVIGSLLMVRATIDGHQDQVAGLPTVASNWLAWGTTAGVVALSLPLLIPLVRAVPGLRPRLAFPPGVAAQVRSQAAGGVAALLAQQVFVVTTLALTRSPGAGVGALPIFQYTQAVFLLPFAVLVVPLVTSAFPALSQEDDAPRFAAISARTLRAATGVAVLGAAALVAAAPALEAFFGALEGSGRGAGGMAMAVILMALGLPGLAAVTQAARALQARRRVREAAIGTALAWLLAAVAEVMMVVAGAQPLVALTGGSSVGMSAGAIVTLWQLRRVAGPAATGGVARILWVMAAAGVGVAGAAWGIVRAVLGSSPSALQSLLVGVITGGCVAVVMTLVALAVEPSLRARLPRKVVK